jgi:hypothetical protein
VVLGLLVFLAEMVVVVLQREQQVWLIQVVAVEARVEAVFKAPAALALLLSQPRR